MLYSVLDLAPIAEGSDATQAIANSVALAKVAEAEGYTRYWLAEHHNMPGIASAATSVMIGHIAGQTSRIRVGSGGIMLPNHSPLVIAEQFGTLASIYPGRIDLGLGRAPGTDMNTARALRRNLQAPDTFPQDVLELLAYLGEVEEGQTLRAIPGMGTKVPLWILGSSLYGAQLAAHLGLPYAFASHFAPGDLADARETYRQTFRPSEFLDKPHFMIGVNVYGAETDAEAARIRTSAQLGMIRLRTGTPGKLPRPVDRIEDHADPALIRMVDKAGSIAAIGAPATVRAGLERIIAEHQPDEVIVAGQIWDPQARQNSFRIAAEALQQIGAEPALA
ncbi:MsnO8 family LLM class oxidoreductase [Pseudooceanicola sp. 216_PA32_1]|uniref:Luciferase-like monooxygenase n=1 Tax=Pseudooceanicola pacificus TaxID=2676438 RepID=A0A844W931_9RHOB|nr:LLM class flavin-dependent oxidoreductase [Pseudooceanicola pacificus]MWB77333.1 MsnO8 family LLM class oxidoreductase [Pseudooceanicola pacificus]